MDMSVVSIVTMEARVLSVSVTKRQDLRTAIPDGQIYNWHRRNGSNKV